MKLSTNFKKLLATVGLAAIVIPTSMSVVGCDLKEWIHGVGGIGKNTNKLVVEAINNTIFMQAFSVGTEANDLKSSICVKFIGNRLPKNIQKLYDTSLFIKHDIVNEKGVSLSDADLKSPITINAKILYSYAEFENQSTTIVIKIVAV